MLLKSKRYTSLLLAHEKLGVITTLIFLAFRSFLRLLVSQALIFHFYLGWLQSKALLLAVGLAQQSNI
jgi:hypothetical protein